MICGLHDLLNPLCLKNELLITGDGSHTLRSNQFAVPYHSTHGALNESKHVFIEMGLRPAISAGVEVVNIIEIGFGTGLNALLAWQFADANPEVRINYLALERYPISEADAQELNYPRLLNCPKEEFLRLHSSAWNEEVALSVNFSLNKVEADFFDGLKEIEEGWAQVIFYDAFAPSSQPELWKPEILGLCHRVLDADGVLVTYCAKGQFKRDLKSVGFQVEPLPGPPGKREMTRGRRVV